ncbi:acyl-CoA dehydrogenase [Luteimonas viscosa]|uniref:Acyl-CoA dehydrogenase n=1 Tax=Luteimonas viscosa TaxID=1132694 RepID=A0A5D4XRK2_9GAMM|nr:acyl-CoA dehydrogenase [Luteimonas viscosa]TYT27337.1 acyl-CoA dehydrogenase [Luteimonas viscosa]
MTSLLISREDLRFQLYDWLGVEALLQAPRFAAHSREMFDAVIDSCERLAADVFAPCNQAADRQEPQFDGERVAVLPQVAQAVRAFADSGLLAATQDDAVGGMQLPVVIEKAALAGLYAANIGACAYPALTIGNASLLLAHGSPAQIEAFALPQLRGEWTGTMCLSEPQAGSSLSDITTRAEFECDSQLGPQYRLAGRKMWISGGEHEILGNIVHLVLAKVPDADGKLPPGTRGISLFIVPRSLPRADGGAGERNDVSLAGLNHKLGYRAAVNCALNFGEGRHTPGGRAGAIGYLVGRPGAGLACMFHLMNEARIGVGLGAAALGCTAYLHALDYARNRPQGRLPGPAGKDPTQPQVPLVAHADVRRMLLAQKCYAEGGLGLVLYCAKLVDEARIAREAGDAATALERERLLDILTPIAKSWPAQWCLAGNDLAIQVHGGYGYTRDYKVEQFWRDNRLNAIHEGAHGIQGIDLLGRKVAMDESAAFDAYCALLESEIARGRASIHTDWADALATRLARLRDVTAKLLAVPDPVARLANATPYLEAFGHVTVAWVWLGQALALGTRDDDFAQGKRQAARWFMQWELPRVDAWLDRLADNDDTALAMRDAWF